MIKVIIAYITVSRRKCTGNSYLVQVPAVIHVEPCSKNIYMLRLTSQHDSTYRI
jgi:hypothetical protein